AVDYRLAREISGRAHRVRRSAPRSGEHDHIAERARLRDAHRSLAGQSAARFLVLVANAEANVVTLRLEKPPQCAADLTRSDDSDSHVRYPCCAMARAMLSQRNHVASRSMMCRRRPRDPLDRIIVTKMIGSSIGCAAIRALNSLSDSTALRLNGNVQPS